MSETASNTEVHGVQQPAKERRSLRVTIALVLSIIALVVSGISVAGWIQADGERQSIENRLACLELPGPNDCQQDAE